jgi:hypothetical protein
MSVGFSMRWHSFIHCFVNSWYSCGELNISHSLSIVLILPWLLPISGFFLAMPYGGSVIMASIELSGMRFSPLIQSSLKIWFSRCFVVWR